MSNLDPQGLQAFIAVAETQSFSAAAEKLHITQPAVSKRIALLESQLDCKLFDRIRRKVFLTEAGNTLVPRARNILLELNATQQAIRDLDKHVTGKLAIAFSHHIGLHRLPPFLQQFTQQYPQVELDIAFIDSEHAYAEINEGRREIAVVTLSPEQSPHIASTKLWRDPLVFVCSPNHPMHLRDNVSLQELSGYDSILPGPSTYTGKIIAELFAQQNLPTPTGMTTNYLETIRMMVSIGLGWSVLPKTMIADLEQIHVPDTYIERQLGIIEYKDRERSNACRAFCSTLTGNTLTGTPNGFVPPLA